MDLEILKDKRILYVEDDEAIMKVFLPIFNKLFAAVFSANNGQDGLELFKSNDAIDFVVSDIQMPRMDGLEMCKEIKELNTSVPAILTSAHMEYEYFLKADEIGIYRYISKPLNLDELLQILVELAQNK